MLKKPRGKELCGWDLYYCTMKLILVFSVDCSQLVIQLKIYLQGIKRKMLINTFDEGHALFVLHFTLLLQDPCNIRAKCCWQSKGCGPRLFCIQGHVLTQFRLPWTDCRAFPLNKFVSSMD